jgi:zinc transport system ATP-binding protein
MVISCRDAAFGYEGKAAVKNLNFSLEEGDYLCVAGENGSGKSTLLKGLLGLLPPLEGTIVRGEGLGPHDTGYLPQQGAARKDFPASVYEVVLSGRMAKRGKRPFYSRADKKNAEENLERLGIADLRRQCYRELSGGQQRRVLLGRSLCAAEKLLVLDEPAAGLDPKARQELYDLLSELNKERGMTIIMVSHDMDDMLNRAATALFLRTNQVFFGSSGDFRGSAAGAEFLKKTGEI